MLNEMYQYVDVDNTVHTRDCEKLSDDITGIGFFDLDDAICKKLRACECCKKEMREALAKHNRDFIEHSNYTYIYTPNSNVFHRKNCATMLRAKNIWGSSTFRGVLRAERVPCKVCKPMLESDSQTEENNWRVLQLKKDIEKHIGKDEVKAIKRQTTALNERQAMLNDNTLTKAEKGDVYTLTQPSFTYFASSGYRSFHLRSCPKLKDITNISGFAFYRNALKAGFSPCRICRPTQKNDIKVSVPITSKVREKEKLGDIEQLCFDEGYNYRAEEKYFYIETGVGKWRLDISKLPIKLEHINLIVTPYKKKFHRQPKVFLSYVDTFDYIKKHDDTLQKKKANGKIYIKMAR